MKIVCENLNQLYKIFGFNDLKSIMSYLSVLSDFKSMNVTTVEIIQI
jgi:hypothetical protein